MAESQPKPMDPEQRASSRHTLTERLARETNLEGDLAMSDADVAVLIDAPAHEVAYHERLARQALADERRRAKAAKLGWVES